MFGRAKCGWLRAARGCGCTQPASPRKWHCNVTNDKHDLFEGIWPESASFNDEAMGKIPTRWKGVCQVGQHFNSTNCNKKIIGARWFLKGISDHTNHTLEYLSARDAIGHGTHTASTAAGYFVENANHRGLASGLARGGAPLAHLAIYKACWDISVGDCTDADILKAFDMAIHDGVDVLTVSLGIGIPLFSYVDQRDTIAIGSFHAAAKGIAVVCSAGNSGPISQTITNTAPWIITVAATTIDRAFPTTITLGNNLTLFVSYNYFTIKFGEICYQLTLDIIIDIM